MWISFVVAVLALLGDQLSKLWVTRVLQPVQDIPLWDGVFHFTYARNTGAAFSILEGKQWVFILFSSLAVVALVLYLVRTRKEKGIFLRISLGLLLGGAIGNLIDRILYNYVIDFLYFKLINYPIFNVADCCVVIGALLLGVYILFLHDKGQHKEAANADHNPAPGEE